MTTKEEYIDALECITKEYYSTVRSPEEINRFNSYSRLFKELAEEHFEEKAETNYEHFKDEIIQNVKYALAVVNGEPKPCGDTNCDECDFKESGACVKRVREWLNQPYKKPTYKLSQFEYDLLQHFLVDFKFKEMGLLKEMKEKGHFKNINGDELIKDILANCEVIK